jgi:hypothetical protein
MIELNNVTLCTVSSVHIEHHIRALRYSSQYFKFAKTKFISDKEINEPGEGMMKESWSPLAKTDWSRARVNCMFET